MKTPPSRPSNHDPSPLGVAVIGYVPAPLTGEAVVLQTKVIGSLFTSFYVISTMANYGASARFGYLISLRCSFSLCGRHTLPSNGNRSANRKLLKLRRLVDGIIGEVRQLAKAVQRSYRWGRRA